MNKADLKQKWSKYCDTDKLVDDVRAMYRSYKHRNSEHGICVMLDTFFTQKADKIDLIVTSPNYIGNLRIAVKKEFDRTISSSEVCNFFVNNMHRLDAQRILKYEDENGKTIFDYLLTGQKAFNVSNMPSEEAQAAKIAILNNFDRSNGATKKSSQDLSDFKAYMNAFQYVPYSKLQEDMQVNTDGAPALKKGTKTSRAFNTVCTHYGIDKFNPTTVESTDANGNVTTKTTYPYNKVFAEYSDLVSDLKRNMYFVISFNPLDYLTMSNGVSWKSCHNIYDGCYKGGVLSYMLDNTSFITFVVNELTEPIHEAGKFYRQMFHYDNGMFMQNRLYPQGNDGATNLYDKFRGFVIEEFATLLNESGEWHVEEGTDACYNHVTSQGMHYKDYRSNSCCNIFYPMASKKNHENHVMTVGHHGICAKCGRPYSDTRRLSHEQYDFECQV